jgi:SAM-dependent methyltransferase
MSEVWSEGYVTDVGYTYGYYRETSPVYQRFCLLLRGLACDDTGDGAAHCELGFGQGISVNINAAANPGHYVATDFNPTHAAHARSIASHAGGNLRLYDDSFEQLLARDDLPEFDSISLHGIWTWVSRDNQRIITKFVARHLKPGGVFYISYNCFPGWAPAYPLRQLFALHDRYAAMSAGTAQRVDAALKFSGALLAASPLFARATPGLDDRLKKITEQGRDYLAHEYLNRDWNCMYFTDVADTLATAKLEFATTAAPLDVVDAVNLTTEGIAFLDGIEHPILREQIRDYFVNQQFRKDLYLRGTRRLSPAEHREEMLATRIVLVELAGAIPLKLTGALGEATLQEAIYRPLIEELAADHYAPKSLRDLMRALPTLSLPQVVQAIAVLVGAGHAAPCQAEPAAQSVGKTCTALNQHLMQRARISSNINFLASPVTGSGIAVGRFEQLFLLARNGEYERPAEWARFVWQLLTDQGQKIVKDGKPLETPEENLAELTAQANAFLENRLPILRALEIVF